MSTKFYDLFNFRSLNKQIKDKKEHRDKLAEDMKRDAEKQVQLEKKIEVNLKIYMVKFMCQKLCVNCYCSPERCV